MREKIAGRGLLAGDRIIHLELREVGVDGLVPVDLTFVSEDAEGEGREGFGDRADGKQGCGRDREFVFEIAIAESFGVDDFAVLYDGQGDARDFPFLHCLTSEIIKALELGSGRGRSSRGGSGGRSRDRKSTRLNSSHTVISYAVFCLKKKHQSKRATVCGRM